jgi:hypothetical protein
LAAGDNESFLRETRGKIAIADFFVRVFTNLTELIKEGTPFFEGQKLSLLRGGSPFQRKLELNNTFVASIIHCKSLISYGELIAKSTGYLIMRILDNI